MWPSTSCTGVCLAITMLQYYICLRIVLTVILVLGLGLGIILYFVTGTRSNERYVPDPFPSVTGNGRRTGGVWFTRLMQYWYWSYSELYG